MSAAVSLACTGSVATLLLDAPYYANALAPDVVGALREAVVGASAEGASTLVLRARGPVFCAGAYLKDVATVDDADLAARFVAIGSLLEDLARAPMLTIACVQGKAVGAGADLVAACDLRIGTDAAAFRFPGARFGLILGVHRLTRLLGREAALEILIGQKELSAHEARQVGLLSHLVTHSDVEALVGELSTAAAALGPMTLRAVLAVVRGQDTDAGARTLLDSIGRSGLADRLREYVREERLRRKPKPGGELSPPPHERDAS